MKHVLVVEDNEWSRELLMRFLQLAGHTFTAVSDGRQAWELLDSGWKFDLIMSDYEMSEMNGLELLRHVRWNDRTAEIPFALMSGAMTISRSDLTPLETVCHCLDATFVEKPFDYEDVIKQLLGTEKSKYDDS